jgi:hypothetical protein
VPWARIVRGGLQIHHEAEFVPKRTTADPTFLDLTTRECICLACRCGRRVSIAPFQLIATHGIPQHTPIFSLQQRFRCRMPKCRRRPERLWIDKWKD